MAIMEQQHHQNAEGDASFDDSAFFMHSAPDHQHNFDFRFNHDGEMQFRAAQHQLSHKDQQQQRHDASPEQFSTTHDSPSPPHMLSLSQIPQGENTAQQHAGHLMNAWDSQQQQHQQSSNSLGLLGGGFLSTATPPRPLGHQHEEQMHQAQYEQHQQQQHMHHHHHDPSSVPSPYTASGMANASWLRGPAPMGDMMNMPRGSVLQRQHSISDLSDASSSSVHNDSGSISSQSQYDPTSPLRASFTPLQSPMGISHSIQSLAGLAIGTPQHHAMNPSALGDYVSNHPHNSPFHGHFTGEHHEELLSLSGTHSAAMTPAPSHLSLMPPPASAINSRRRSTGVAHTLYTGQVHQLRQEMAALHDAQNDETTPMPPSHQTFSGLPSEREVSGMASSDASSTGGADTSAPGRMPTTPRNKQIAIGEQPQHPNTVPAMPSYASQQKHGQRFAPPMRQFGSGSSGVPQLSPDDSSALSSSISGSAFSAPRLNRTDSFDSYTTADSAGSSPGSDGRVPGGVAHSTAGRLLEATFDEHERKVQAAMSAAHTQQHGRATPQTPSSELDSAAGERTVSPISFAAGDSDGSSAAMSRTSSVPSHGFDGVSGSIPSTPVRSGTMSLSHQQQVPFYSTHHNQQGLPATPVHHYHHSHYMMGGTTFTTPNNHFASHQRMQELTMSAPQMAHSRSLGSLPSPGGVLMSPVTPLDMQRHQQAAAAAAAAAASHGNMFASSGSSSGSSITGSDANLKTENGDPFGTPSEGGMILGEDNKIYSPSSGVLRSGKRSAGPPPLIVSSADKMHICYCGKRFKRLEHLKRHNRVHTQERPHACPAPGCNKWFGRTDNLTQHLKTHYRTLGRTSETLLQITQAAAAVKANGPEARALVGVPPHSAGPRTTGDPTAEQQEARHDPHAAAAAAAAQAVSKTNMKRRITISNDMLGRPISLGSNAPKESAESTNASSALDHVQVKKSDSPSPSPRPEAMEA